MWWIYFAIAFLICWIVYEAVSGSWNYGAYNNGMMITSYVFLGLSIIFAIGAIAGLTVEMVNQSKKIRMLHCKIMPEDCKKKVAICNKSSNNMRMTSTAARVNGSARKTFSDRPMAMVDQTSFDNFEGMNSEDVEAF